MDFQLALILLPLLSAQTGDSTPVIEHKCEYLLIRQCQDLGFRNVLLPNHMGQNTQEHAAREMQKFHRFFQANCSEDFKWLLCFVYAPVCNVQKEPVFPCKEVCDRARSSCEPVINTAGFQWPSSLRCEGFPDQGTCMNRPTPAPPTPTHPTLCPICMGLLCRFQEVLMGEN
uniref:FZ domain-containing protein n=1 Tax=Knipowitschia caucasica TaxID=637954 RepID=A0AAV2KHI8_KNICA